MTELDSVIASLTEQLKESISISAEELNVQKENFAQQKKSLSENRDEVHARLEINSARDRDARNVSPPDKVLTLRTVPL